MLSIQFVCFLPLLFSAVTAQDRPSFKVASSRVKPHFHSSGEPVAGEEDLLKVILSWEPLPFAEEYEICHNCVALVDAATGEDKEGLEPSNNPNRIIKSTGTYGGKPSIVMPGITPGANFFHLRVIEDGKTSKWSKFAKLDVVTSGQAAITLEDDHDEL